MDARDPQGYDPDAAWKQAVEALLSHETLIWHDRDKKGRARERDCRPALLALDLEAEAGDHAISLRLQAAIDQQGRSLRPQQLQHWLAEQLERPLHVSALCRQALLLRSC